VQVGESASLLRVFIEDLLDITRIREQKMKMDMAVVDLAEVLRSSAEITAPSAREHGIEVTLHFEADSAPVRGDRVRLQQVVWNLLSNAVKFTPAGGAIRLRLERSADEARLVVTDTGVGITADFAPHVFELYRQSETAARHVPGLGIGLSIASQIVKLHGGTIRVESEGEGRGSTFIVTLPLELTDEMPRIKQRSGRASPDRPLLDAEPGSGEPS
jgi:signal transduction histidine kinase